MAEIDDLDPEQLAELESLLYSQIHHGANDEDTSAASPSLTLSLPKTDPYMSVKPRYFLRSSPRITNMQQPSMQQVQPVLEQHITFTSQLPQTINLQQTATGSYINVGLLAPPDPARLPDYFYSNKNQRKRENKKVMQKRNEILRQALNNAEIFKGLNQADRMTVIKMQKRQKYLENRRKAKKAKKELEAVAKFNEKNLLNKQIASANNSEKGREICEQVEVIELSESDDDEIVLIEPEVAPIIEILDDDEKSNQSCIKTVTSKDPVATTLRSDAELMRPPSDIDTMSSSSGATTKVAATKKAAMAEMRELLHTPDSSNDFLENSTTESPKQQMDTSQSRVLCDVFETESSCSTSDVGAPLKDTGVFNEMEFENPDKQFQLFGEADLESFGEFITPKRKNTPSALTAESLQQCNKPNDECMDQAARSHTDSSSESEPDEDTSNVSPTVAPKRKRLPSLSHFEVAEVPVNFSTPVPKSNPDIAAQVKPELQNAAAPVPSANKRKLFALEETPNNNEEELGVNSKRFSGEECMNKPTSSHSDDDWEIEIIEQPPLCITLSDNDSDEEFHSADLNALKTDLQLPNVSLEKSHNSETDEQTLKRWTPKDFDFDAAFRDMPSDSRRWKILECDRVHIRLANRGPRCNRCREIGHVAAHCQRKEMRCWLCGDVGHTEPRCPIAVCTRCGRQTRFLTPFCGNCRDLETRECLTCGCTGHPEELCPDLWRRYHLTVEVGDIIQSKVGPKPRNERWCSGCARQGHLEEDCNYYSRIHPKTKSSVQRYDDVYELHKFVKKSPKNSPSKEDSEKDGNLTTFIITGKAAELLETIDGRPTLQALVDTFKLKLLCEIEGEIKLHGLKASMESFIDVTNEFIEKPLVGYRKMKLAFEEADVLTCKEGASMLHWLNTRFSVRHRIEKAGSQTALCLQGSPLRLLRAGLEVKKFLLRALKPDVEPVVGTTRFNWVLKAVPHTLKEIASHPAMIKFAAKNSVEILKTKKQISFASELENSIAKLKRFITNVDPTHTQTTYSLLQRVNALTKFANDSTLLDPHTPLQPDDYAPLNFFIAHRRHKNGTKKAKRLFRFGEMFANDVIVPVKYANEANSLLKFFEKSRKEGFYEKHLSLLRAEMVIDRDGAKTLEKNNAKDIDKTDNATGVIQTNATGVDKTNAKDDVLMDISAEELYSLEPLQSDSSDSDDVGDKTISFKEKLPDLHSQHLVDTIEGRTFMDELKTHANIQVERSESQLVFYNSTERQKANVLKEVAFYFQIREFEFPHKPQSLYESILVRLSRASFDYYHLDCKSLYTAICDDNSDTNKSRLFIKLHGLLFAKYEFLKGAHYVDVVVSYLDELSALDEDATLPPKHARILKNAIMWLFCPFPLDVDYEMLTSLAVPPKVPAIAIADHDRMVQDVRNKFKIARRICMEEGRDLHEYELNVFESYLVSTRYSRQAVEVAIAYLSDRFPSI